MKAEANFEVLFVLFNLILFHEFYEFPKHYNQLEECGLCKLHVILPIEAAHLTTQHFIRCVT